MSPTIAVGDNPLYESSYTEHLGSGDLTTSLKLKDMIGRLKSGDIGRQVSDVKKQLNEAILENDILRYQNPILWKSESSACLVKPFR